MLEFFRARGASPVSLCLQICAATWVWMLAVVLCSSVVCLTISLPKNPAEAWLWLELVSQYAGLYLLVAAPLLLLGTALGTRAGEVIAFCVPVFLLFMGLLAASWLEPVLTASTSPLHRVTWLALPHYHLADLTPRLVFKMGPLVTSAFTGSALCLALQGAALSLIGLCTFRTRS